MSAVQQQGVASLGWRRPRCRDLRRMPHVLGHEPRPPPPRQHVSLERDGGVGGAEGRRWLPQLGYVALLLQRRRVGSLVAG